jgi:hypothetical protein
MTQELQREIARKILMALYEAWAEYTTISLDPVQAEGGWDDGIFNTIIEKLNKQLGLIKSEGTWNMYTITPAGVFYAEENGIVPEAETEKHRQIRTHILKHLSDLYDREGSGEDEHYEKIAAGAPIEETDDMLIDLELLTDAGLIADVSSSSFKITEEGLRHYRGTNYEDII